MWLSLSGVLIASLVLSVYTEKGTDPIVNTGYAKYLGNRTFPDTVAYLGIPYAEPPLGERRFRAPLPLDTARVSREARGAVINATTYPAFCIQGTTGAGDAGGAGSEDCLKVNIYMPAAAKKGSNCYIYGNPANWPFDHWIHQSPDVVIVSVYYRLSSFGFLALPEFEDSNLGDFNAGFLDQTEALQWVKRHIASFGGNPDMVTINGESAGGSSVELHLIANRDANVFTGAIAQSVFRTPLPTPEQQKPLFQFYAQHAGCGSGSTAEQLACLSTGSPYKTFHPVLDGKIFTEYPTQSIASGKFASVPLIVGATTNETLTGGPTIAAALTSYCPSLTAADIATLEEVYPGSEFASDDLHMQTLTGDVTVRCARTIMATDFSENVPAWTYRYNQSNPTLPGVGVAHAAENWMMFLGTNTGVNGTTTFTPMTPIEDAFASELIAYWLSFVRSGDPNTYKLARSPVWPSYSAEERSRIVLQQAETLTASGSFVEKEVQPETHRCEVIANQAADQQN
ncbi:hypothetical protein C0995_009001 [Termitomyces sp. Mi166|nr:hypothetical protein C0995_009001 [Termitomyces sp. Mi166\